MEILKVCHCLNSILLWNLEFLHKYLPIKNSGITFQSRKSSSNNRFTQEHCILVILFLKLTFFKPPFSYPLQRVLCLIFVFLSCQMKFFLYFIHNIRCSIKKLFLKILQYSQENIWVGVSFLMKMQAFSPLALLKRDSNTGVLLWILRNF